MKHVENLHWLSVVLFCLAAIVYFWHRSIKGSNEKALLRLSWVLIIAGFACIVAEPIILSVASWKGS